MYRFHRACAFVPGLKLDCHTIYLDGSRGRALLARSRYGTECVQECPDELESTCFVRIEVVACSRCTDFD